MDKNQETGSSRLFKKDQNLQKEAIEFCQANLVEMTRDLFWQVDTQGKIIYINRAIENYGYDVNDLEGKPIEDLLYDENPIGLYEIIEHFKKVTDRYQSKCLELEMKKSDGSLFYSETHITPQYSESDQLVSITGVTRDITARKELEENLRQSQKMEAVGSIAGGIAHDFNNLLMSILGYSSLLLNSLDKDDAKRKEVEEIQNAGEKAAALTRQLLAFSSKQILTPKHFDLNEQLIHLDPFIRRIVGEDIEVITLPMSEPIYIKADSHQIEQAILNLVMNARDAMPDGGKLYISIQQKTMKDFTIHPTEKLNGGIYAIITIQDTGKGIHPDNLQKIYEPFFSTKEKGKTTGLGLSTTYGIVRQSGGTIDVYSKLNEGTTVTMYLPCTSQIEDSYSSRSKNGESENRGSETILLVEDEAIVRKLVSRMLREAGYKVIEASYGSEALDQLQATQSTIHLLLTDIVMPGINGSELARQVLEMKPDIEVIYMSGYTNNISLGNQFKQNDLHFIQKPVMPAVLLRKVREVLDKKHSKL